MDERMKQRIEHTIVGDVELKQCSKCLEPKLLNCFGKDKSRWDGLYHVCKECRKAETLIKTDETKVSLIKTDETQMRQIESSDETNKLSSKLTAQQIGDAAFNKVREDIYKRKEKLKELEQEREDYLEYGSSGG